MTDEQDLEEKKPIDDSDETPPDEAPEETQWEGKTEEPETPPEEPCDPATMSCDEMRDKIIGLTEKRTKYDSSIKKLDDVRDLLPSEELEKAHADAVAKKKEIDDEIYGTFEKFTICTTRPSEPEKEEKPEENPKTEETE